ncbi:MAG: aminopeptidase [Eubacterium sp.]|nr:aminopeptidase [Eubacterium sp.]
MATVSNAKKLKEKLFKKPENLGKTMSETEIKKADKFCEDYKSFLDLSKTERASVTTAVELCKKMGFSEFSENVKYRSGDRVFQVNRGKSVIFAIIGESSIANGVSIIAAHIDSPRIDLKQNPLYEDGELAFFKTHYYGGIKKYQWTTIPLSLQGVIIKNDGSAVNIKIGEDKDDPVFVITDLLPHLSALQYKRPVKDLIKGEELNLLIGSRPFKDDKESELVKLNIMRIINEKYGIVDSDFRSAELEAVPAFKASDVGFDRSLIGAYGQDDRVCAYAALKATLDYKGIPNKTVITVLADKEEVGSDGNTGLNSSFLKYFVDSLAESMSKEREKSISSRAIFTNSKCLSADVGAGFDPGFPDVLDKMNAAFLNYGVAVMKYSGSGGKSGTNDASAEYIGEIRSLFEKNNIAWQTVELGKVDMGGGGTVAKYISFLNVDTIDIGVPVLSMHSPFEITAKNDIYMAYKAFSAFIGR